MHLVLGPGGAGVSTIAAAAAVGPSGAAGQAQTLLVTLDRFRQASRVFGVYSVPGQAIPISQRAHLLEIDTLASLSDVWAVLRGPVALAGGGLLTGISEIDPDEITGLPGLEQLLAWRRIRDEAVSRRWDSIVVDCSGGIDPLDFLGVPELVSGYIEKIWPRHRRLTGSAENPRVAGAATVVDTLATTCTDIVEMLVDPNRVHAHLVTPPGLHGREMTHRHLAVLHLMGVPVSTIVVNPGPVASPLADVPDAGSSDVDVSDDMATGVRNGVTTVVAQAMSQPPRSVAALRGIGVEFTDGPGVAIGTRAATVDHLSGAGLSAVYRMRWRQPLPDPETLALGRSGDDLVVTVSGYRKRVALSSVLRRCSVEDARWEDGMLNIRFQPDPRLWPRQDADAD